MFDSNRRCSASLRRPCFALASRQQSLAQTAPLARATNLRIKANRVPPRGFVKEPVPERPQRLAVKPSSAPALRVQASSVCPRSPPPNRRPFSRGRRRSTPVAPGLPAGWPEAEITILSLLSLISRNSPKRSGMVSPELSMMHFLSERIGPRSSKRPYTPGAQTERRGEAEPVSPLLGGENSPAALL